MTQLTIFDAIESERHAAEGIALAADNRASLVIAAREIAVEICRRDGDADMDRVMYEMAKRGYRLDCLGNAAGAVFKDRRFEFAGSYTKATRIQSHGNRLCLWQLAR